MTLPGADGTLLHAYMIKPSNFDETKSYPLLMHTYGGPGNQSVSDSWGGFFWYWYAYLAQQHGIIVACVDNRGSSYRGKQFAAALYRNMGTVEPQDQLAAAKHWGALPYIDKDRIGIWGWSYGGYNSIMTMLKYDGPEVIKLALAVAPGVDWELYDTIYTERYMSTPQMNAKGYEEGKVANFVANMSDRQKLMIVHGDMDDNAHYQNTVQLVSALQKANKQFRMMVYPGGNHSMRGTGNRFVFAHLFGLMTDFVVSEL